MSRSEENEQTIGKEQLQPADIIISAANSFTSKIIRTATISYVSHASLYYGNGHIIESIGDGVSFRSFEVFLAEDTYAAAYRSPEMTPDKANEIVTYAKSKADAKAEYLYIGDVLANTSLCDKATESNKFFCSQLVIESYQQAGLLKSLIPSCITPEDIARIVKKSFNFVGTLKGTPSTTAAAIGLAIAMEAPRLYPRLFREIKNGGGPLTKQVGAVTQ
ncbi:YiiX/YebB-like N1pC/P60 family cysteine hydrolase [Phaeospirillum tilakii]|uniref:YiiX/YebB-like N1pC/P60 family cysteine hydrolase n=1 Tax=Phaeospirillum tilakii TaxID=741673 RepID=A0ABW5CBS8_9PROT